LLTTTTLAACFSLVVALSAWAAETNSEQARAIAELKKWTDEQLRAELEKASLGGEDERLLLEVVRRGGEGWKKFLAARHDALVRLIQSPIPADRKRERERWGLSNLHLLTALRRVQNRPDPLRILVGGKLERSYSVEDKPSFTCLITNLDEEKQTVYGFTDGGHYRSGRLERWRFEIYDEKGKMAPMATFIGFFGGGLSSWQTLEYGESWEAELPLKSYVGILAPGKYRMRVFYHNEHEIAPCEGIGDFITSHSADIALDVSPVKVYASDEKRRDARKWISKLPDTGPVKMAIGIFESKEFLNPDSPPGRLQRMYNSALPDLIDAVLDPNLKPGQRAWVLGLLFAITGHNDPRDACLLLDESDILGAYEYCGDGEGSCSGGKINPEKQKAFAEKWRVWKTNRYYIIEEP
jgi:hypothetical protein